MNKQSKEFLNLKTKKKKHNYTIYIILLILALVFWKFTLSIFGGLISGLVNPFVWLGFAFFVLLGRNDRY